MATQYQILEADEEADLATAVEAAMADGWSCQGGVQWNNGHYHQAMVK